MLADPTRRPLAMRNFFFFGVGQWSWAPWARHMDRRDGLVVSTGMIYECLVVFCVHNISPCMHISMCRIESCASCLFYPIHVKLIIRVIIRVSRQ
jgi:hypothetical protein